jgi:hypothetical protein
MNRKKNFLMKNYLFCFLSIIIISILIESCGFCPKNADIVCNFLDTTQIKKLTDSSQALSFEDPGTIIVVTGSGCAESKKSGTQEIIKVKGGMNLPAYATNAAIFINGWHLKYLNGDQHIHGLASIIGNIQLNNNPDGSGKTLNWQAGGTVADENFDNPYSWCYYYTVVAWNDANLVLTIDQKDGSCDRGDAGNVNFYTADNGGTYTALSSFASFLHNPDFISEKTVAILPRGFGFEWNSCNDDHHLLQIGYNLDHSEKFIGGNKYLKRDETVPSPITDSARYVDSGYVSWQTYTIFKDNDTRRDYQFGEMVSGFGGNDLEIIQPPFSILPIDGENAGALSSNGVVTQNVMIKNVPFKYAVPMLTGWDLNYITDDQHVKEIGVWMDSVHYDVDPVTQKGILRYKLSSVLADDDNWPDFFSNHKVTILGFKRNPGINIQKLPELVPFSPLGTEPSSFCRMEDNGKLLRVTIKNIGNADAGPFKTTVAYNNNSFTLDTPPIAAGASVDLLFKVPSNCFSPDCSFKITVDSNSAVDEINEGNNNALGGCTG